MQGLMTDKPLLISSLIDHAARYHGDTEIVSCNTDGTIDRSNYKEVNIRAKKLAQSLIKLGIQKIQKNNVLVVEFNEIGILKNKELYNLDNLNNITFDKEITDKTHSKNSYIYGLLTSLREKINAPTKKRNTNN